MKQQPREALVVAKGKEKARKAVDSPPIIQLCVKNTHDPQEHFLQNPYLFMVVSLYKADRDEALPGAESLTGTLASSLHRLKDGSNRDIGLFVFGDISVKVLGTYRLHFRLCEFDMNRGHCQHLASITSDKFNVLAPKDFKGMEESSMLSRNIADQGVRLRLRKEARNAAGTKRPYPYDSPVSITPARPSIPNEYSSSYEGEHSPVKRENVYNAVNHNEVPVHATVEQSYGTQPPYKRTFSSYPPLSHQPSLTAPYGMMNQPSMVGHTPSIMSSPPGVLPSNTTSAYPVDNLGLYNPTYSSSSSAYQSSGPTYQGSVPSYSSSNYPNNNIFFNGYDNSMPR
jgi:hypothetical protein